MFVLEDRSPEMGFHDWRLSGVDEPRVFQNTDPEAVLGAVRHRFVRLGPPSTAGKRLRWEVSRVVLEQPWREDEQERAFIWPTNAATWFYRIRRLS